MPAVGQEGSKSWLESFPRSGKRLYQLLNSQGQVPCSATLAHHGNWDPLLGPSPAQESDCSESGLAHLL